MSYRDQLTKSKAWAVDFEFNEGLKFEARQIPRSYAVELNITGAFDGRYLDRIAKQLLLIQKEISKE